jgi:hypothetical protein
MALRRSRLFCLKPPPIGPPPPPPPGGAWVGGGVVGTLAAAATGGPLGFAGGLIGLFLASEEEGEKLRHLYDCKKP